MNLQRTAKITAASLLATTLIAQGVLAAIPLAGHFNAAVVQAEGTNDLTAPLAAFLQKHQAGIDSKADPAFHLTAESLRVQTYYFDPTLHSPVGNRFALYPQSSSEVYENALVQGLVNRDDYRWYLFALNPGDARIETTSTCSSLQASPDPQVTRESKIPYDAPDKTITVATADTLQWTDCSSEGATIKTTGDFLLMLWEWDATLHVDGQEIALPSGQARSAADPIGSPESQSLVSYDRQRYLYVEGGTLTLPHLTGSNYALYAGPEAHLEAGELSASSATGSLVVQGTNVDLSGGSLKVSGAQDVVLAGQGVAAPLRVQLSGSAEHIEVNGQAVATVSPSGRTGSALAVVAMVGLVAVPALAYPLARRRRVAARSRRVTGLLRECMELAGLLRFREAHDVSRKLLDLDERSSHANFAHAVVLAGLGHEAEAMKYHANAAELLKARRRDRDVELIAENALKAGLLAARLSNRAADRQEQARWRQEAERLLNEAVAAKPDLRGQLVFHEETQILLASEAVRYSSVEMAYS